MIIKRVGSHIASFGVRVDRLKELLFSIRAGSTLKLISVEESKLNINRANQDADWAHTVVLIEAVVPSQVLGSTSYLKPRYHKNREFPC